MNSAVVETFLREPTPEQLNKFRKDDVLEIRKHLVLGVRKAMRKAILMRIRAVHIVNNDIFEEEILNQLSIDVREMSQAQIELVKTKIYATTEIEKTRIEQEFKFRELEISRQDIEVRQQGFDLTKQVRLVPKFQEDVIDNYFSHFEKTAINYNWPRSACPMLQTVP